MTGNTPTFAQTTIVEGGSSLFFEPIPMDWLYTSVTDPQVNVVVDTLDAACANVDCNYNYAAATASITSQAVSGLAVTIGGTSLPTTDSTIVFGGAPCGTISGSATELTCTLEWAPYAGDINVELYDASGLIPGSGLTAITVAATVTGVSPSTDINQNGGDEITITGTGFPNNETYVTVTFTDGTGCTVSSSTPTQIVCTTDGFDKATLNTATNMQFSIKVIAPVYGTRRLRRNLRTLIDTVIFPETAGTDLAISDTNPSVSAISPNSLSPVLAQDIVFTLTDYTSTMVATDFLVVMYKSDDLTVIRQLNVVSIDDSLKTMTVRFPGAATGTYIFKVTGATGKIQCDTSTMTVSTKIEMTDY